MPLDIYWDVKDLLKEAAYILASQEESSDIFEVYRKVFKKLIPHAIFENDRVWLSQQSHTTNSS